MTVATIDAPVSDGRSGPFKPAIDLSLLFRRYLLQLSRSPVWLVVGFSTPLLYLALFSPLLKHLVGVPGFRPGNVYDEFLPGILSLLAFSSGTGPGFNTIFELRDGVIERFRVTPASRFAILIGPLLAAMLFMFVLDAIVVLIGFALGFQIRLLGLAVLAVLLGLLMATMGSFSVAMALTIKEINGFAATVNGLLLPVLLLGGVLLPISFAPTWMQVIAHFDPLYYVVTASRILALGVFGPPEVWQAFAVLVPLCLVVVTWATSVVRRAVA